MLSVNPYDRQLGDAEIAVGDHRRMIGGMWDAVGRLQFEYLVAHGLRPEMRLVDIGCGALRGGVHFVRYLEAGNYFGLDVNQSLLDAGYDIELAQLGLQDKLPRSQLIADDAFTVSRFGQTFDMGVAHSVFTHLPLNYIRRCLAAVSAAIRPGGLFFATFYELPDDHPPMADYTHQPGGITTHPYSNPYHYRAEEIARSARDLPLVVRGCEEWEHPRAQRMITFERA